MDAQTCLKKLEYVGVLAFATVDKNGAPQIRNISAIHYESDRMIFFTAKGKAFCEELLTDGRVQVLGYTKYKEMIRLSAKAVPVPEDEQEKSTRFLWSSPILPTSIQVTPENWQESCLKSKMRKSNISTWASTRFSGRATPSVQEILYKKDMLFLINVSAAENA